MTFYFYDLETSGVNPREQRIMQFAGQRTDMALNPVGEPLNILIKLTDDIVPEPDAVLITGITPQAAIADGITEAAFLKQFHEEIATPDTIFVGFNSIRFDDEFMRYLHYRNFYDPYEWQWQDGRGKWDLLDVVRMTRALRPGGIEWPFDSTGAPTNRLELLTAVNKLDHANAHDALSDVHASIAVARLIYNKQTKLFEYLLSLRDKREVAKLVNAGQPFVYTSGRYPSEQEKTTVAVKLADHPKQQGVLVYDLRHDPSQFSDMTPQEVAKVWRLRRDEEGVRLPVKPLVFTKCPAVAPLGVLDKDSQERLQLDLAVIEANRKKLAAIKDFPAHVLEALSLIEKERQSSWISSEQEVDGQLYDGFIDSRDKTVVRAVRAAKPQEVMDFSDKLADKRLQALLPLYKARNFPKSLSDEERAAWEKYRTQRLVGGKQQSRLARYFARLQELAAQPNLTAHQQYLLEELQLYGQSIMPDIDEI